MKKRNLLIILGNLTAFGPFITDFYLPCLPKLVDYFSSSASVVQISLTAGMLGLAVGQLLIGPVSDKYGRKRPLLGCLLFFILSTIGCMLSQSIGVFIFFRLLQGLTGSCGLVISKAIVADSFSGGDLAKYFAILAAVQGAAPIVAPVAGGLAFNFTSWRGTFAILGLWGGGLLFVCRSIMESLNEENRLHVSVWKTFLCYSKVFKNGKYNVMNLLQGFGSAALMAYISASPFIFQQHFGLSPLHYSILFAFNALGLVIGSAVVVKFQNMDFALSLSVIGLFVSALFASASLLFSLPFLAFEIFIILMLFCVGMLTPVGITLALKLVDENRGTASALLGATPYLLGGIVAPLTGIGNMVHSMPFLLTLCATICFGLYILNTALSKRHSVN